MNIKPSEEYEMKSIPVLTEHDIRIFVGKQNFSKGLQSVHNGAIVSPAQQGMALKAYCYGSLPEPYRVQVACDDTCIVAALCSCSEDTLRDGKQGCEHAAALLLAWHIQPETFTPTEGAHKAAERAEEACPRASIDLSQQHVEHLITGRGRGNYQVACRYLIKIR